MNLIYMNPGNSSVMESQVLTLIGFFQNNRKIDNIFLMQGFVSKKEKEILKRKIGNHNIKTIWFRTFPNFLLFQFLTVIFFRKKLKSIIGYTIDDKTILHIRGERFGRIASDTLRSVFKNNRSRILVDIRGASVPEIDLYYGQNIIRKQGKKQIIKKSLNQLASQQEHITTISARMKKFLVDEYKFSPEVISINPNITDEKFLFDLGKRNEVRIHLKIRNDEILAVSLTGGGASWQKDEVIMDHLISKGIKILNLSTRQIEKEGVINLFVPYNDVPNYLNAADFAIIWRDNNLVNNVASPSKFSEFSVNGLPVLHNGSVDLVTEYIKKHSYGQIVEDINDFDLKRFSLFFNKPLRQFMSDTGKNVFGVKTIGDSYFNLYKRIIESSYCM